MPVVKKTVAIDPKIDRWIRNMWAALVVRGYDVGYSTALNILLSLGIYQILTAAGVKEYANNLLRKVIASVADIEVSESVDKVFKWLIDNVLQVVKSISNESKKGSA